MEIRFKNLDRSEFALEAANDRIGPLFERFPDLRPEQVVLTLSMENSPQQAGPDQFTVKFRCREGRYRGLLLEKSASNLYAALADLVEHLLERLNRFGDRHRVKERTQQRKLMRV